MLNLKFYSNDLDRDVTIREWLQEILLQLIEEGEAFSGKRPLGNSDWLRDVAKCLYVNGKLKGVVDKYGDIEYDWENFDNILKKLIKKL